MHLYLFRLLDVKVILVYQQGYKVDDLIDAEDSRRLFVALQKDIYYESQETSDYDVENYKVGIPDTEEEKLIKAQQAIRSLSRMKNQYDDSKGLKVITLKRMLTEALDDWDEKEISEYINELKDFTDMK